MVINVFNHTVMQGEKGVSGTVHLPSLNGKIQVLRCIRFPSLSRQRRYFPEYRLDDVENQSAHRK